MREFCQSPQFSLKGLANRIEKRTSGSVCDGEEFKLALLLGSLALTGRSSRPAGRPRRPDAAEFSASFRGVTVGVTKVAKKSLDRQLTVSSELVPFQEIDVYAKESGYVKTQRRLRHPRESRAGDGGARDPRTAVATEQDDAAIKNATGSSHAGEHELSRVEAQHNVLHLQYRPLERRREIQARPGGAAGSGRRARQGPGVRGAGGRREVSTLQSAQSQLAAAQAKREHDQVLFDYSKITAPFAGVVTQRYANLGTLMQAGTSSSTQAMPLVQLSQDDLFRLVIPVPESYVHYITSATRSASCVPSLNRTFPGKVARFSVDVKEDTRTMHTEVDVPNPNVC